MIDASHSNLPEKTASFAALFLRIFWMFLGNIVLGVSALMIAQAGKSLSLKDAVFWVTVPLLAAARYMDISWFKGNTVYGEPASMADWRRYTAGLLLVAVGAWLAIHGVGYLLAR